jgi:hypothetical protein
MTSSIDQFGRSDNTKPNNDEKSKKILEALSDIKNQLQNDNFEISKKKEPVINKTNFTKENLENKEIENLNDKLNNLEKKINSLSSKIILNSHEIKNQKDFIKEEKSVFHKIKHNQETVSKEIPVEVELNQKDNFKNKKSNLIILLFIVFFLSLGVLALTKGELLWELL